MSINRRREKYVVISFLPFNLCGVLRVVENRALKWVIMKQNIRLRTRFVQIGTSGGLFSMLSDEVVTWNGK
jgi:hypothetical protein